MVPLLHRTELNYVSCKLFPNGDGPSAWEHAGAIGLPLTLSECGLVGGDGESCIRMTDEQSSAPFVPSCHRKQTLNGRARRPAPAANCDRRRQLKNDFVVIHRGEHDGMFDVPDVCDSPQDKNYLCPVCGEIAVTVSAQGAAFLSRALSDLTCANGHRLIITPGGKVVAARSSRTDQWQTAMQKRRA